MKRSIVAAVVLCVVLLFSAAAQASLSSQYLLVFSPGISYSGAQAAAQSLGNSFHLAAVNSPQEQGDVQRLLQGFQGQFWIQPYQVGANSRQWMAAEPWLSKPQVDQRADILYYGPAYWFQYFKDKSGVNAYAAPTDVAGFIVEISPGAIPIPGTIWVFGSGLAMVGAFRLAKRNGLRRALHSLRSEIVRKMAQIFSLSQAAGATGRSPLQ